MTAAAVLEEDAVAVRRRRERVSRDVEPALPVRELGVRGRHERVGRELAEPVHVVLEQEDVVVVLPRAAPGAPVAGETDLRHDRGEVVPWVRPEVRELGLERGAPPVERRGHGRRHAPYVGYGRA